MPPDVRILAGCGGRSRLEILFHSLDLVGSGVEKSRPAVAVSLITLGGTAKLGYERGVGEEEFGQRVVQWTWIWHVVSLSRVIIRLGGHFIDYSGEVGLADADRY
jgi:hypothetical protein